MSRAFTRALDAALRVTLGTATLTLGAGCQSGDPKSSTSPPPRCTDDRCCEAKIAGILHGEHRLSYDERVKQELRARLGEDGLACCVRLTRATDGVTSRSWRTVTSVVRGPSSRKSTVTSDG